MGLIALIVYLLANIVRWQMGIETFISPLWTWGLGIALFVYAIIGQVQAKKKQNGYIDFKNALGVFVLIVALGLAGDLISKFLVFNVLDPEAKETYTELAIQEIEKSMEMIKGFAGEDFDSEQMSEITVKEMRKPENNAMNIKNLVIAFFSGMIFFIIGGLISGAIIKKKEPESWE